jgi:hypothetical protein
LHINNNCKQKVQFSLFGSRLLEQHFLNIGTNYIKYREITFSKPSLSGIGDHQPRDNKVEEEERVVAEHAPVFRLRPFEEVGGR